MKKLRTIILINPHYSRSWQYGIDMYSFPIGLLYLGTVLKRAGFNPVVIDTCVEENYQEVIEKNLPETLYVGFSAMTPQVPHALEIARKIRRISPKTPLVWGGIHPTLYSDTVLHDCCDVVVNGEGEEAAVELARFYSGKNAGNFSRLKEIKSLSLEHKGAVFHTPPRKLLSMDKLPWLDYDLIDSEKYIYTWSLQELRMVRVIPIHAARGCPWHCTFCINTTINSERRYRYRDTDDMLDEIESLVKLFKLEMIILSDEEFFADRHRVEEFLDGIEKRNLSHIRFNATCRVNHFRDGYIDALFLKRLKKCGFVNLVFGFESGSPDCLETIRKEITVDMGLHAARLLASEGFMAVWGFIMAIPGEKRTDLVKTLRVMEKIRRLSSDNYFIGPQIFRPYPGSELYSEALKSGLAEPVDLEDWGSQKFTDEGWIGTGELLWIKPEDRSLVDYVNYIGPVYFNRKFINASGLANIFHIILRSIFKFRLAANMWIFPVEHKIRTLGKSKLNR